MIIQIYEIEKDCLEDRVLVYPACDGINVSIRDWQEKYGVFALMVHKIDIFNIMKDMDNWCCNNFGECCYFEFG